MALAKRSPEIRHASAVRADDMVGSCGITTYWMFSAVKYRWSVGSDGHHGPPLRLTSLASLALTAPGEERGREVRRIAMSFRRAGLFLWRIRIWLHHLPIKMPGGMTEHRQNDSETDEER